MNALLDLDADVGSDEDEEFDENAPPRKSKPINGEMEDSSEEEDDDDDEEAQRKVCASGKLPLNGRVLIVLTRSAKVLLWTKMRKKTKRAVVSGKRNENVGGSATRKRSWM